MTNLTQLTAPIAVFADAVPRQHFRLMPELGSQVLGGKTLPPSASRDLELIHTPSLQYDRVRKDIARYAPMPVTRVAMRFEKHVYSGVIDSACTPYFFSLDSKGMVLRKARNAEKAWYAFEELLGVEMAAAAALRQQLATDEQRQINEGLANPTLVIKAQKAKAVRAPGSRGGVYYYHKKSGKLRYGHPSIPPARHAVVPEHKVAVAHHARPKFDADDHDIRELHTAIRAEQPSTAAELRDTAASWFDENDKDESVILPAIEYMLERRAISYSHDPAHEETSSIASKKPAASKKSAEIAWKDRALLAPPQIKEDLQTRGTPLIIGGKAVKLSPEAEYAALSFAKRLLAGELSEIKAKASSKPVKRSKAKKSEGVTAEFRRNFEQSIRKLYKLPRGPIDYKNFIARVKKEAAKPKKPKAAALEMTHTAQPDKFILQDGQYAPLNRLLPASTFYTGKNQRGAWNPRPAPEEYTYNLPKGAKLPKGMTGNVVHLPDKEWLIAWEHPVEGGWQHIAPKVSKNAIEKFSSMEVFERALPDIRASVDKALKSKTETPQTKAAAFCCLLMDRLHIRVGLDKYAGTMVDGEFVDLEDPTFGVATLRPEHVSFEGTTARFTFVGKKGVTWNRTLDLSGAPGALAFIKSMKAKGTPGEWLWQETRPKWRVTSGKVNQFLAGFAREGVKPTAKDYRTYHANKYMAAYIEKLEYAKKAMNLSKLDMKLLYQGVTKKSRDAKHLFRMKIDGQRLFDYLGFEKYVTSKGVEIYGALPSVAAKLGNTIDACRKNYIDPIVVTKFAFDHDWDERTIDEKRTRKDLPGEGLKRSLVIYV